MKHESWLGAGPGFQPRVRLPEHDSRRSSWLLDGFAVVAPIVGCRPYKLIVHARLELDPLASIRCPLGILSRLRGQGFEVPKHSFQVRMALRGIGQCELQFPKSKGSSSA